MNINSEFSIEEFHQLILNASSYMTKIQSFSFKIVNSNVQSILKCLTIGEQLLKDQNSPIIKKLFVLRFVKDTMILASLSFYQCFLIKIMPWVISAIKISETNQTQKRIQLMGKFLRGSNELMNSDMVVCKTILQLIQQMIKWMGTNIRDHPYSKLTFRSIFRLMLQKLPRLQNMRVTDLTFFKTDDPNKYQAYFIERDSGESEGQRIAQYISQSISQVEKGVIIQELEVLTQTGDQYVITAIVQQIEGLLQDVSPSNIQQKVVLINQIHRLLAIGQVEMANLIKDYLLEKIVMIALIFQKHKEQFKESPQEIRKIVSMVKSWNAKCQTLLLPVETFREVFRLFERQGINYLDVDSAELNYQSRLNFTFEVNKDKLNQIDCNEAEAIKRIRSCKYIPVYESIPNKKSNNQELYQSQSLNQEFLSSHKSYSRQSKQSNNSNNNKKQFLQAFSKFPQQINQIKNNSSQMKQIYLQHSNLSDRFHPSNNAQQPGLRPLIMSFKKVQKQEQREGSSPEVVFSDSFTSNQKNSPYKMINSKDYINLVHQPSMSMQSEPHSLKKSQSQRVILSQHSSYNNKKQSNKDSISNPSNQFYNENANHYNDYMMQNKQESSVPRQSNKSSRQGSKLKIQKSSSLARSQKRGFFKSTSREKMAITPISKISNSKSINILQFNQAQYPIEQRYTPEVSTKVLPPAQQIKVQKTIQKPKFGFKLQQDSIITENETKVNNNYPNNHTLSKSDSISNFQSFQHDSQSLGSIPENFMDLLKVKPQQVRVNGFEDKVRQLQKRIEKMKSKKQQVVKEVFLKQKTIQKLKQQMPLPKSQLQEENLKLKKAIMQPKKIMATQVEYKQNQAYETKGTMKHVSITPLREEIKKQLLYSKCRLYKGEYVEVGFQVKNKQLAIYLTFLASVEECTIKVQENSLILAEEIDAKIYKLPEGKQIKFKAAIKNHQLFNGQFHMANLIVKLQISRKQPQIIQLCLPFHLFNIIKFVTPRYSSNFNKITDWHYCCNVLLTNPHYISDYFPQVKSQGAIFSIRGELDSNSSQIRIIVDNDKFAIEFEGVNESFELTLVRCVMALLQKTNK